MRWHSRSNSKANSEENCNPGNCEGFLEMPWLSDGSGVVDNGGNRFRVTSTTNQVLAVHLGPGVHNIHTSNPDRIP